MKPTMYKIWRKAVENLHKSFANCDSLCNFVVPTSGKCSLSQHTSERLYGVSLCSISYANITCWRKKGVRLLCTYIYESFYRFLNTMPTSEKIGNWVKHSSPIAYLTSIQSFSTQSALGVYFHTL